MSDPDNLKIIKNEKEIGELKILKGSLGPDVIDIRNLYDAFYKDSPNVNILRPDEVPDIKSIVNTNDITNEQRKKYFPINKEHIIHQSRELKHNVPHPLPMHP